MPGSIHNRALQLKGIHKWNQGGQASELDALIYLCNLIKREAKTIRYYCCTHLIKKQNKTVITKIETHLLQEPQDGVILQVRDILLKIWLLLCLISNPVQHLVGGEIVR